METQLSSELERRYANVRAAMAAHDLDALIVSGSEYSGFEGAVTYLSGFQIVHRYAYVVVPADGEYFFPRDGDKLGIGLRRVYCQYSCVGEDDISLHKTFFYFVLRA